MSMYASVGSPPANGSLVLLSKQTASASSSIVFTQFSTTYSNYVITYKHVLPSTNSGAKSQFYMYYSQNAGVSYLVANNVWMCCDFYASGVGAGALDDTGSNSDAQLVIYPYNQLWNTTAFSGFVNLYNVAYAGGNEYCAYRSTTFASEGVGGEYDTVVSQGTNNANLSAVNAVKLAMSVGNITSGTFTLYGVLEA